VSAAAARPHRAHEDVHLINLRAFILAIALVRTPGMKSMISCTGQTKDSWCCAREADGSISMSMVITADWKRSETFINSNRAAVQGPVLTSVLSSQRRV
jgi:hypothetical protein